ncbi:TIR domain containing protein, partial [Parasponia andersonii]
FLSFRGDDTRYSFVSHLYAALVRNKIKTYKDDENLKRGHEISDAILQAIHESKLYVVIFSENYASSTWCLDELVHILQCKERNKQIVIPVFYHVDPAHVRKQLGNFGRAFLEVEKRFNDKIEKVKAWRAALSTAANLSGWDSSVKR